VEELRDTLFDPSTVDPETIFEHNRMFHAVLLRASGNPLVEVLARPVFRVLYERFLREQAPAPFWSEVDRDHRVILAAVAARDAAAARAATLAHLRSLRPTYMRIDRSRQQG
jgi:GntR family transcriptional regulator, transcriptional repressor for pyruvate dehydrogenase complex